MLTKLKNIILYPWHEYKRRQALKKKLMELRKKDPYIYEQAKLTKSCIIKQYGEK